MKKWIALCAALLILGTIGYRSYFKKPEIKSDTNHKMVIGLSFDSLVVERWKRDMETLVAVANEMGIEVDVQIANDDLSEQKRQIQYLIDRKVDVLLILPKEKSAYVDLVQQAKRNGIPVVAYDRLMVDTDIDAYIAFDNVSIGRMMAERLVQGVNGTPEAPKNIMIINGDPGDNNSNLFNKGFYDVLNRPQNKGTVQVVSEIWSPGWRESYGTESVEALLKEGIVPDGILAGNDMLATAAIQALAERQLAGKVLVVSEDAELSACQRIVEGTQLATVYKPYSTMARRAIEVCVQLKNGTFQSHQSIWNGLKNISMVQENGIVVDRSNIDRIIVDSGFHSHDDVYRNVTQ